MIRKYCQIDKPIFVIPPIVTVPMLPKAKQLAKEAETHILFIGADAKRKGLFDLVQAFQHLKGDHKVQLDIVSRLTPEQHAEISIIPGINILQTGISNDQVSALMERADIFVMTTYAETFGFVLVEAMARGCALVSSDYAPINEMIENNKNGFVVKPGDVDAIRKVLSTLVRDPASCARMCQNNREQYQQTYTEQAVVPLLTNMFNSLR